MLCFTVFGDWNNLMFGNQMVDKDLNKTTYNNT